MSTASSFAAPENFSPAVYTGPRSRFYSLHMYRQRLRDSGVLKSLSQSAALVLLALAELAKHDTGLCWPSVEYITERNPVSERGVYRALAELERRGLIVLVERRRPLSSNLYRLVLNHPALSPATVAKATCHGGADTCHGGRLTKQVTKQVVTMQQAAVATRPAPAGRPAAVVDPSASPSPESSSTKRTAAAIAKPENGGGELLPLTLPEDLAELPRRRRGLSAATIRQLVGQHGTEAVRQAVAVIEHRHPEGRGVESYGGMLRVAVRDGWRSPKAEAAAEKAKREEAIRAAAPPAGTRWAVTPDGTRIEVAELGTDVVRLGDGGVIPRDHWPMWRWESESLHEPTAHKPQEGPCFESGRVSDHPPMVEGLVGDSGEAERRQHLAAVAFFSSRCKTEHQLADLLARHGVSRDELEAFKAEQAAAEGGSR